MVLSVEGQTSVQHNYAPVGHGCSRPRSHGQSRTRYGRDRNTHSVQTFTKPCCRCDRCQPLLPKCMEPVTARKQMESRNMIAQTSAKRVVTVSIGRRRLASGGGCRPDHRSRNVGGTGTRRHDRRRIPGRAEQRRHRLQRSGEHRRTGSGGVSDAGRAGQVVGRCRVQGGKQRHLTGHGGVLHRHRHLDVLPVDDVLDR